MSLQPSITKSVYVVAATAWRHSCAATLSSPGSDSGYSDHAEALWAGNRLGFHGMHQRIPAQHTEHENDGMQVSMHGKGGKM